MCLLKKFWLKIYLYDIGVRNSVCKRSSCGKHCPTVFIALLHRSYFASMSKHFIDPVVFNPFTYFSRSSRRGRFLKLWASSTKMVSIPRLSKVMLFSSRKFEPVSSSVIFRNLLSILSKSRTTLPS